MRWRIKASEHDRLRSKDTKAKTDFELPGLSLRIVRFGASHIGGKLAREVKTADINNLKAVIYCSLIERAQKFDCATPDL